MEALGSESPLAASGADFGFPGVQVQSGSLSKGSKIPHFCTRSWDHMRIPHGIRYHGGMVSDTVPHLGLNPDILQNRAELPRSESPHGIGFGPKNQIRYRGGLGSRTAWQIQGSIRYDPICRCIKYPGSGTISDQEGLGINEH